MPFIHSSLRPPPLFAISHAQQLPVHNGLLIPRPRCQRSGLPLLRQRCVHLDPSRGPYPDASSPAVCAAAISILSPNSQTTWYKNSTVQLTWSSAAGDPNPFRIFLDSSVGALSANATLADSGTSSAKQTIHYSS